MSQEDKLIRIRQKSDTAENWVLNNPVLLYGELGLEIDTQKIKMGDGVTPWTGLRYVMQDVVDNMNNKAPRINCEFIKFHIISDKNPYLWMLS